MAMNSGCRITKGRYSHLLMVLLLGAIFSLSSCRVQQARATRSTLSSYDDAVYSSSGLYLPSPDCKAYAYHSIPPTGSIIDDAIALGKKFLGKPYRYRGPSSWPMDCSGYVRYIFSCFDIHMSGSSSDLAQITEKVKSPRPGDLLFFKGRNRKSNRVGHVALVIEVEGESITMMHSTNSRGVIIEKLETSPYFSSRFLFAGRIPQLRSTIEALERLNGRSPFDLIAIAPIFSAEHELPRVLKTPLLPPTGQKASKES